MFSLIDILKYQWQRCIRLVHIKKSHRALDSQLIKDINAATSPYQQSQVLLDYFWLSHKKYLSVSKLRAYYPGFVSMHGSNSDGIEGIARILPLLSAWTMLHQQLDELPSPSLQKQLLEINAHLTRCFEKGTNKSQLGFWGEAQNKQQLICEASDVALALWLSKEQVFSNLSSDNKQQIIEWLTSFIDKQVEDNNWHVFVVLIDAVVSDLNPRHKFRSQARLQRVMDFAIADGAFTDGEHGSVDYYNAWGFHYTLFWINQIYPHQYSTVFATMLQQYSAWYQYLFTQSGFPIYGRSLAYRYAAPAPLLAAACSSSASASIDANTASTIHFHVWRYFTQNGGVSKGRPNQGLFKDDKKLLDVYSGPASALWGTRSLVMLFWLMKTRNSKDFSLTSLPSQQVYEKNLTAVGCSIHTYPIDKVVTLQWYKPLASLPKQDYYNKKWKNTARELLYAVAFRAKPNIFGAKTEISSNLEQFIE